MLIGWRAVPPGQSPKRGALVLGCVAALLMGVINVVVGCTNFTDGIATPDTKVAPAYRASVSASVSASVATSSIHESQRQQSLTTKAIRTSCDTLATSSSAAIDKVNVFVKTFNQGQSTSPTEGPAIDALNDSASTVGNSLNDAMSSQLRDAFNAYVDAAHAVANAIGTHASTGEFNKRVDQLNDTKTKALKMCLASF
jgi:cytoskeletal protein RodZ